MTAVLANKDLYYYSDTRPASFNNSRLAQPVLYVPVTSERTADVDRGRACEDDDDEDDDDTRHAGWNLQQQHRFRGANRFQQRQQQQQQQQQWLVPAHPRYPVYARPPQSFPYSHHRASYPSQQQTFVHLPQQHAGPPRQRVYVAAPVHVNHEQLRRQQQFYLNSSRKQQQARMPSSPPPPHPLSRNRTTLPRPPPPPPSGDMLSVLAAACSLPNAATLLNKVGEKRAREARKVVAPFVGPPAAEEVRAPRRKKRPRLAPFPNKLQEIVVGNPDVVTWDERTRALVIRDPRKLSAQVMPKYFNTNGGDGLLKSFTRQLNYYGFHRITSLKSANAPVSKKPPVGGGGDSPVIAKNEEPLLLLHLGGNETQTTNVIPRQVSSVSDDEVEDEDALVGFYRELFGEDALVFINKDKTLQTVDDFPRLIRFEKATARVTLDDHPSAYMHPFRATGGSQLTTKKHVVPVV